MARTSGNCKICGALIISERKPDFASTMNEHIRKAHSLKFEKDIEPLKTEWSELDKRRHEIKKELRETYGYTLFGY